MTDTEDRLIVVPILALAYSGVTWLNMVASSHPEGFYLGAGKHVLTQGLSNPLETCLEHRSKCDFWPRFFQSYDANENLIVQLARFTGKRVFVVNNPPPDFIRKEFVHPRIDIRGIKYLRNGQALLASAVRHTPEFVDSTYQTAVAWLYRGTRSLETRSAGLPGELLTLKFEDCLADVDMMLATLSRHIGVAYTRDALRYWEHDHHPNSGNTGVLDVYLRMRGHKGYDYKRKDFYDRALERARATGGMPLPDESWKTAFDEIELAAYDFAVGDLYEGYGYARPSISEAARKEFRRRFNPPATVEEAEPQFGPFRRAVSPPNPPPAALTIVKRIARRIGLTRSA